MRDRATDDLQVTLRRSLTRRALLRGGLALGASLPLAGLLAACGGDDEDDDPVAAATTSAARAATGTTGAASAPTTVSATATTEAAAPTEPETASPSTGDGEWTFTDDRGITVTLPRRPERIVAQTTAAASLWDYGIRPTAIFGPQRLPDGSQDPQAGNIDLDTVESLGEVYGEVDLELLVSLQPDLLVSIFYDPLLWGLNDEEAASLVDEIVPSVGINVSGLSITEPIARFEELAQSLGADLDASEVAEAKEAFEQAEADLTAAIEEKPELTVAFVAAYPDLLYVANPAVASDVVYLADLGLDIVTPDVEPGTYWEELSWEQANKYPADLILNDVRVGGRTPDELAETATWASLPAVQAEQIGPWYVTLVFSHAGFMPVIEELAGIIRESRDDIV